MIVPTREECSDATRPAAQQGSSTAATQRAGGIGWAFSAGLRPTAHPRCGSGDVIDHYQYLLLMAGCLLVTLPLELALGARVYRRPGPLLTAVIPVVVVFSVWDVAGILAGHWSYNPAFVTGARLAFGMPVEELVFFIVVPICGLLTYEAVGVILGRVRSRSTTRMRSDDA